MTAVLSSLFLFGLVVLVFFQYDRYRVDKLRQDLFAIRDELFDLAADGKISFDSSAYKAARSTLNGLIRFAHKITFSHLVMMSLMVPKDMSRRAMSRLSNAVSDSSAQDRKIYTEYVDRANLRMARHLMRSPLLIATLLIPLLAYVLAKIGVDLARLALRRLASQFKSIDTAAYAEGQRSMLATPDAVCSVLT